MGYMGPIGHLRGSIGPIGQSLGFYRAILYSVPVPSVFTIKVYTVILYQPTTIIRPYLINIHTELNNCSTVSGRERWFAPEETKVLVRKVCPT